MKGKSWSIPCGMIFKKYHCSHCGTKLVKSKTHRVVSKKDKDYYQYHDVGTYPRYDYDVYSYEFKCTKCNKKISYTEQCIIERIQKKYHKKVLANVEIKENYKSEKNKENKRILRRNIIIPLVMLTIFFMLIYILDKDKNNKKLFVYSLIYIILTVYTMFMTIRSYKGKHILRRNQNYSNEQKLKLEKIHAYCTNNKELIGRSDKCYCFHCKKIIDSNEITRYLTEEDTALCPYCGIDAVIPDCIDEEINEELINDMNNYWF
ncbi:MAG: hypothetical protein IJX78_05790 [Bacilli bacterium]|nr:hypothetical protein [Bacilli bacterium]